MPPTFAPLRRLALTALAGVSLAACAPPVTTGPTVAAPAPAAAAPESPLSVRWVRTSAEHRAIFEQTYRSATDALERLAAGQASGRWAVVLDADETVLDNSEYQRRRALLDSAYTPESWNAWVNERRATALPGAVEFVRRVRALGGRAVIVTNRTVAECDATRANLASVGIAVDLVLCRPPETGDKNPRFAAVQNGTAAPGTPALGVLMYLGDNIQDFPALSQAVRTGDPAALAPFGRSWFLLPNPMYGSWERNPDR